MSEMEWPEVYRCPECGEMERASLSRDRRWRRWPRYAGTLEPFYVEHWHNEEGRGKPGEFVRAEAIQVAPVSSVAERLLSEGMVAMLAELQFEAHEIDDTRDRIYWKTASESMRDEWREDAREDLAAIAASFEQVHGDRRKA